jgi:3-phosphoshikimate 1-carboxyvinyltransferase
MNTITVSHQSKILKGEIQLPASKSISNRALIIQYLSGNKLQLDNLSSADDTQLMISLLKRIEANKGSDSPIQIDCNNAGTVLRFLTALLAITTGKWLIDGSDRMKERPVGILVESLNALGANIHYVEKDGFPPLLIYGKNLKGRELEIDGSVSSQYISALMLIAPVIAGGLTINLTEKASSRPYIDMTLELLKLFGCRTSFQKDTIRIEQQEFQSGHLSIESDWSSASFWYEMAAFAKEANLVLKGLQRNSIQGDSILPEIFNQFGVNTEFLPNGIKLTKSKHKATEFKFDFKNYPDLAQPFIATCAGLNIIGNFTGLESLRIKETDRIIALQSELKKLGYDVRLENDSELRTLNTDLPNQASDPIKTYGDHRMALAFAPLSLKLGTVQIENQEVVSKSYPHYWEDLMKAGFTIQ